MNLQCCELQLILTIHKSSFKLISNFKSPYAIQNHGTRHKKTLIKILVDTCFCSQHVAQIQIMFLLGFFKSHNKLHQNPSLYIIISISDSQSLLSYISGVESSKFWLSETSPFMAKMSSTDHSTQYYYSITSLVSFSNPCYTEFMARDPTNCVTNSVNPRDFQHFLLINSNLHASQQTILGTEESFRKKLRFTCLNQEVNNSTGPSVSIYLDPNHSLYT